MSNDNEVTTVEIDKPNHSPDVTKAVRIGVNIAVFPFLTLVLGSMFFAAFFNQALAQIIGVDSAIVLPATILAGLIMGFGWMWVVARLWRKWVERLKLPQDKLQSAIEGTILERSKHE